MNDGQESLNYFNCIVNSRKFSHENRTRSGVEHCTLLLDNNVKPSLFSLKLDNDALS